MKFILQLNEAKSLNPPIVDYLKNIPEDRVFGHLHPNKIRHPGALFNHSQDKIIGVLKEYIQIKNEMNNRIMNNNDKERLITNVTKMISHICSFEDEAYLMLVSLSPPATDNPKFAYEWLKENKYEFGANLFRSSSVSAMELWNQINNRIKHNGQRLSGISSSDGKIIINGFFVEGIDENSAVGPDKQIHDTMLNGTFGLSFDRVALMILFLFYFLSDKLCKSIRKHMKEYYNFTLEKSDELTKTSTNLSQIWNAFNKIEYMFFPQEYKLKFPKIKKEKSIYKLTYPHGDILYKPENVNITASLNADGYSRKYKLPGMH